MHWDDLRVLLAVCDAGSVSAAARKLEVDKATVSRRVTALERDLGVRLMVRRTDGWRPTRAGLRVAGAARAMDGDARALLADLAGRHGSPRTTVAVTAPHWFSRRLLLPALPSLLERAPWLDMALATTSRVLNLAQREADVAIRNQRPAQGDYVVRRAGVLGSALYASRSYLATHGAPSPGSLEGHVVIGYVDKLTYLPGLAWLDDHRASADAIHRMGDADMLLEAVRAGLGVAGLPCCLGEATRGVRRVSEVHRETIWLVSPTELAGTRAVRLTRKLVADVFASEAENLSGPL